MTRPLLKGQPSQTFNFPLDLTASPQIIPVQTAAKMLSQRRAIDAES